MANLLDPFNLAPKTTTPIAKPAVMPTTPAKSSAVQPTVVAPKTTKTVTPTTAKTVAKPNTAVLDPWGNAMSPTEIQDNQQYITDTNQSTVIDASKIGQTQAPAGGGTTVVQDNATPFVTAQSELNKMLKDNFDTQAKNAEELNKTTTALEQRLTTELANQKGSYEMYKEERDRLGIPTLTKELSDLNTLVATKTAEFEKSIIEIGDQRIPMGFITGQQASVRNRQAAEIGALASLQQAKTGNLTLANELASKAVELQFADQKMKIDGLNTILQMNYTRLSAADQRKAEALNLAIQAKRDEVNLAQTERNAVLKLANEFASQGGDAKTMDLISKAKTQEEALKLAGSFIGKAARDKATLDLQSTKADIAYKYAQINALKVSKSADATAAEKALADRNIALASTANDINGLLKNGALSQATGLINPFTYWTPGTNVQEAKAKLAQVKGQIALNNRAQLKGGGSISDFETKMLNSAASALETSLSDSAVRQELVKVRGALLTMQGVPTKVIVTNAITGVEKEFLLDSDMITSAIQQGHFVKYVE